MTSFEKLIYSKKAQFVAIGFGEKQFETYCEKNGDDIYSIVEGINNKELNGMHCLRPLINEMDGVSIETLLMDISEFIPDLWYKTYTVELNGPFLNWEDLTIPEKDDEV